MVTGRPTKYSPQVNIIALSYLKRAIPENMDIPTIEGLALELDIDDETITEWAKKHPEFSATVKKIKTSQKKHLITTGLFGGKEINAAMAIFLLKVNHNLNEKQAIDITSNGRTIYGDRAIDTIKNS